MAAQGGWEKLPSHIRAQAIALNVVLAGTESHFKTPGLLDVRRLDAAMDLGKEVLIQTQKQSNVRMLLGHKPEIWDSLRDCLYHGLPALETQAFAVNDPIACGQSGSAASLAASFTVLQQDIERVNDICMIARNLLVSKSTAQDLAANAHFQDEVLKLIDLCVRVTAKGYDGEGGGRVEERWARVATGFKRLLITCLQFLNNFVTNNERRKLLLWMDLFGGSSGAEMQFMGSIDFPDPETNKPAARALQDEGAAMRSSDRERYLTEKIEDIKNEMIELNIKSSAGELEIDPQAVKKTAAEIEAIRRRVDSRAAPSLEAIRSSNISHLAISNGAGAKANYVQPPEDPWSLSCTTSKAALNLGSAKEQLIERLREDSELHASGHVYENGVGDGEQYDDQDDLAVSSDVAADGSVDEEEDAYQASMDRDRGLLTDIPLVLGPNEIEALPMIIQAGIVDTFASPNPEGVVENMQAIRCNILISQESGRNLLRELLIFVAAWDLLEETLYFKIMMQITEAILKNGLAPLTYQAFAESKDIVSPAQAVFIKLLTQLFRAKQGSDVPVTSQTVNTDPKVRADVLIIRYMFTQFRESVIPETCALVYLQGQIRSGAVHPEDFPLNLWDMERVYEGVYQFLEFFAVLTETEEWKKVLVEWEVTFELVTLLKELELGIPKGQLMPRTPVSGGAAATDDSKSPTPVAVERPYELAPPSPTDSPSGASSIAPPGVENPEDFEWRNLKKLVILVLSSLVWKSTTVQDQVRQHGGVEMVLQCCNYDSSNPYIREHAIMCLRFLLEGNENNMQIVRELEARQTVPSEVLDKRGYETFIDEKGKVGLRRKEGMPGGGSAAAAAAAQAGRSSASRDAQNGGGANPDAGKTASDKK